MRAEPTGMSWVTPGDPRNLGTIGGSVYPLIAAADLVVGEPVIVASDMTVMPGGGGNGATGVVVGGRLTKFNCCDRPSDVGIPAAAAGELVLVAIIGIVYEGTTPFNAVRKLVVPKPSELLGGQEVIATGVGDGSTDNDVAFQAATDAVNSIVGQAPVVLRLAPGHYKYSAGFYFNRQVIVDMPGVFLDYTGTNRPMQMGPTNLSVLDNYNHRIYQLKNMTFLGGQQMSQGIYWSTYVTVPVIEGVWFLEFGNTTNPLVYGMFFQSDNWDINIRACQWLTRSDSTGDRNWIKVNGFRLDGSQDFGQSRLTMLNCQGLEQGFGQGVGVYVNGVATLIGDTSIAGFKPNIALGPFSIRTRIIRDYFETTKGTECIRYGDPDGIWADAFAQWLYIEHCFANLHNDPSPDYHTTASFLGNGSPLTGLQYCQIHRNNIAVLDPTRELIRQPVSPSQIGNVASGNEWGGGVGNRILHTPGVASWSGEDANFRPLDNDDDSPAQKSARLFGGITVPAGTYRDFIVSWVTPFPDLNYTYNTELYDNSSLGAGGLPDPNIILDVDSRVISWDGSGITIRVRNRSAYDFIGGIGASARKDGPQG